MKTQQDRDPIALLALVNPLTQAEQASLAEGPERERTLASISAQLDSPPTGFTGARRRLFVVPVVVALGLLIPLVALGTANEWWFQRDRPAIFADHEAKPVNGDPGIVATGTWQGEPWTVIGYTSHRTGPAGATGSDTTCVSTIIGSRSNPPNSTSCGGGWMTYHGGLIGPALSGAVAAGVARLQLVSSTNGKETTIDVPLKSLPNVEGGIRFFVVDDASPSTESIVALDAEGNELQRRSLACSLLGLRSSVQSATQPPDIGSYLAGCQTRPHPPVGSPERPAAHAGP